MHAICIFYISFDLKHKCDRNVKCFICFCMCLYSHFHIHWNHSFIVHCKHIEDFKPNLDNYLPDQTHNIVVCTYKTHTNCKHPFKINCSLELQENVIGLLISSNLISRTGSYKSILYVAYCCLENMQATSRECHEHLGTNISFSTEKYRFSGNLLRKWLISERC